MKYTVTWKPIAEATLADLWNAGPDRSAVADAADEIDARLRRDPYCRDSESREGTVRIIFIRPLAALYEVFELDRRVDVLKVWRPRSHV